MSSTAPLSTDRWPEYLSSTPAGVWRPDPLGPGFEHTTLNFGTDAEGEVVATMVRYNPPGWRYRLWRKARGAVVCLHGWSDYYYNRETAKFWHAQGYHFYALDLRRHGRSLRAEHELPGFVTDLKDYDQDLNAAMELIHLAHPNLPVIAQGHSLGGLILSLWTQRCQPNLAGLVLNAPWLEFQGTAFLRVPIHGLLEAVTRSNPRRKLVLPQFDHYWQSLSNLKHGEWDVHRNFRPTFAFPNTAGWLRAVLEAHAEVAKGLNLEVPILVLTSRKSHLGSSYTPQMQHNDSVIDVQQTRERSLLLGDFVTNAQIDGALHDVFASALPARTTAYEHVSAWLRILR